MPDIKASMLKFYSVGIVAANKSLSSDVIEVTPIEHLPFLNGAITDAGTTQTATGTDATGTAYNTSVATSNTIKATWFKQGVGNRKTSPDVRRGAYVAVYQFADADQYFWMTLMDDSNLRKLETVIYAFSGTQEEGASTTADNSYFLEVSTHTGSITLHTSKANGEFATYDFQINAKGGQVQLQDSMGNYLTLDSTQNRWELGNGDQSVLQMMGTTLTMTIPDSITMKTKTLTMDLTTWNVTATQSTIQSTQTTHNGNFTENGAFGLNGDMVTAANSGSFGSQGTGQIQIAGNATLQGSMNVVGPVTATSINATTSITAPNLQYN
ncbi:hypothetical protein [Paraburkholderia sp. BCC1886]|uniref:hypothetical protein n=1 Tax=Paraburkholderia sp. BCC1886 TaxID=2562670 RepID=UPI001183EFEB|nr:hypothetical protein [Paraburkholderia sp. BCC1886]